MKRAGRLASAIVGGLAAFVGGVSLARAIRPALLLDPDSSWALPRLMLGLLLVVGSTGAGVLAATLFRLWSRSAFAAAPLPPLPLSRRALPLLFTAAALSGMLFRFADLAGLPSALWEDDVSLIAPTLALTGTAKDFADSVRPVMYGVSTPYGSVGVLYLELFRGALALFGTTVFGLRFLSAAAGVLSLFTAAWLARVLLPRGGATLAAVILAGLRWHLILSRWGWVMILMAPLVDLASIAALRARRNGSLAAAAAAGLVVGIAAHVYLAAWIAGAALLAVLLWPRASRPIAARLLPAVLYVAALGLVATPLFVFREGRVFPYLRRVGHHNVLGEMRLQKSWTPAFYAAADAALAPWLLSDPTPRHDLPGRRRLPLVLGAAVAIALARALVLWREDLSALLLAQSGAAFAAAVAGGQFGLPNGSRFAYLADTTAVAAAAGVLWAVARFSERRRKAAAIAAVGILAAMSLLGARDLDLWARSRPTFLSFSGQDTLIGRAASRWNRFGTVTVDAGLGHSPEEASGGTIGDVERFRLDPEEARQGALFAGAAGRPRSFRVRSPAGASLPGERVVERVQDDWGRSWAVVVGSPGPG